jgi:sugar-specific transcriptional regulator TrmB
LRKEAYDTLVELGLTDLETKVYLALVQLGDARATEICKLSKVTRTDIYRVLSELAELGLVEKTITKPLIFVATPLRIGICLLLERRDKKTANLKIKVEKMVNLVEKQRITPNWMKNFKFIEIPNRGSIIKEDIDLNRVNWQTMNIVTLRGRFVRWIHLNRKSIDEMLSKGVKIRVIVSCPNTSPSIIKQCVDYSDELCKNPMFQAKYVFTEAPALISLYDYKAVRMALKPSPFDIGGEGPDLYSDHPSLVGMARTYFECLWNSAKTIQVGEDFNLN